MSNYPPPGGSPFNPYQTPHGQFQKGFDTPFRRNPRELILPPGICMIVVGALGFLGFGLSMVGNAITLVVDPRGVQGGMATEERIGFYVAMGFVVFGILNSGLVIAGGISMVRMRGYTLAMIACVAAILPCVSPCYLLGIPFGIWGLIMMLKPEVKAGFQ